MVLHGSRQEGVVRRAVDQLHADLAPLLLDQFESGLDDHGVVDDVTVTSSFWPSLARMPSEPTASGLISRSWTSPGCRPGRRRDQRKSGASRFRMSRRVRSCRRAPCPERRPVDAELQCLATFASASLPLPTRTAAMFGGQVNALGRQDLVAASRRGQFRQPAAGRGPSHLAGLHGPRAVATSGRYFTTTLSR